MKNLLPTLVVAYCFAFASCKKDYTCTFTLDIREQNHAYSSNSVVFPYTDLTSSQERKNAPQKRYSIMLPVP